MTDDKTKSIVVPLDLSGVKPLRVEMKLKNNRLIRARESLGYKTVAAAARAFGFRYQELVTYETMYRSPWNFREDNWKKSALEIADAYGQLPEDLWPEVIMSVRSTKAQAEVDAPDFMPILELPLPDDVAEKEEMRRLVQASMEKLTPSEEKMIRAYYGFDRNSDPMTMSEIARQMSISPTRVAQKMNRAIEKLRLHLSDNHLYHGQNINEQTNGIYHWYELIVRAEDTNGSEIIGRAIVPANSLENARSTKFIETDECTWPRGSLPKSVKYHDYNARPHREFFRTAIEVITAEDVGPIVSKSELMTGNAQK